MSTPTRHKDTSLETARRDSSPTRHTTRPKRGRVGTVPREQKTKHVPQDPRAPKGRSLLTEEGEKVRTSPLFWSNPPGSPRTFSGRGDRKEPTVSVPLCVVLTSRRSFKLWTGGRSVETRHRSPSVSQMTPFLSH